MALPGRVPDSRHEKGTLPTKTKGAATVKEVETMIDQNEADAAENPVDVLVKLVLALMGVSDDG